MTPGVCARELRRAGGRLEQIMPTVSGKWWWAFGVDNLGQAHGYRSKTAEGACSGLVRACLRSTDRTKRVGRRSTGHYGQARRNEASPPVDRSAADTP